MRISGNLHLECVAGISGIRRLIPAFARITQGKVSDMAQARLLNLPRDSVLVFNRGITTIGGITH